MCPFAPVSYRGTRPRLCSLCSRAAESVNSRPTRTSIFPSYKVTVCEALNSYLHGEKNSVDDDEQSDKT
jgi:hypothetical protein